jgi:hypothetical protein
MKNGIGFNSVWAISAPLEEEVEIDPDSPFYEIMLGFPVSIMEGSYFYINGSWSYCPSCAYHVNIDEVTVYGSFSSNVSSYAPQNTSYSDIWRRNNDFEIWDYWNYGGGSSGTGSWAPDPNFSPSGIQKLDFRKITEKQRIEHILMGLQTGHCVLDDLFSFFPLVDYQSNPSGTTVNVCGENFLVVMIVGNFDDNFASYGPINENPFTNPYGCWQPINVGSNGIMRILVSCNDNLSDFFYCIF